MEHVQVRVGEKDVKKLKKIAEAKEMTFAQLLREIFYNYLRRNWTTYEG